MAGAGWHPQRSRRRSYSDGAAFALTASCTAQRRRPHPAVLARGRYGAACVHRHVRVRDHLREPRIDGAAGPGGHRRGRHSGTRADHDRHGVARAGELVLVAATCVLAAGGPEGLLGGSTDLQGPGADSQHRGLGSRSDPEQLQCLLANSPGLRRHDTALGRASGCGWIRHPWRLHKHHRDGQYVSLLTTGPPYGDADSFQQPACDSCRTPVAQSERRPGNRCLHQHHGDSLRVQRPVPRVAAHQRDTEIRPPVLQGLRRSAAGPRPDLPANRRARRRRTGAGAASHRLR